MRVAVVIPAYNEEQAIAAVVQRVPRDRVHDIVVVDNGSSDATAAKARAAGGRVVAEAHRGYGAACRAGLAACRNADVIVFMDGDSSDDAAELPRLLAPIARNQADFVIGSRLHGACQPGAMPPHARFGNWLLAQLLRRAYRLRISDVGSFKAIRTDLLLSLQMTQMSYGWPAEMLVKAARREARIAEVPVSYRKRIGRSKVSGTLKGSVLAAYYMLWLPLRYLFKE